MESLRTEKVQVAKQKDVFITRTAIKTLTSESIVEKVIGWHFRQVVKALKRDSEVEISGFGTFKISQRKLKYRLQNYKRIRENVLSCLRKEKDTTKILDYQSKLDNLDQSIEYLNQRISENKDTRNFGGLEKPPIPTRENKGDDRASITGEAGDV